MQLFKKIATPKIFSLIPGLLIVPSIRIPCSSRVFERVQMKPKKLFLALWSFSARTSALQKAADDRVVRDPESRGHGSTCTVPAHAVECVLAQKEGNS